MSLLDRLTKVGTVKGSALLSESAFFGERDSIRTDLPILNIACGGSVEGGLSPGLTVISGASKSFKTLLGLYCLKAYLKKYPDAICLFYDSEFGTPPDYLKTYGIDASRVIHIPIEHVEQLKFDIVKRLEEIQRGDRVFIFLDSLGNLASKKEVEDALEEKSAADMSRAKAIRSLLRIVTPHLTMKDLPFVMINHVYAEIGTMYPKTVIPGGSSVTYSANSIFVITKAQEKDGTEIIGWNFTINIEKSRYVKEKSKFPINVTYEDGISKWSGLMDIALASGHVSKPSNGWYQKVDPETGELVGGKMRLADTANKDFWSSILSSPTFDTFVKAKYRIASGAMVSDDKLQIDEEID